MYGPNPARSIRFSATPLRGTEPSDYAFEYEYDSEKEDLVTFWMWTEDVFVHGWTEISKYVITSVLTALRDSDRFGYYPYAYVVTPETSQLLQVWLDSAVLGL